MKFLSFWERVKKDGEEGCWVWQGGTLNGYGRFVLDHFRFEFAHRHSYESLVGKIPDKMRLHHKCGNKLCVNPKHLQVVSAAEHMLIDGPARKEKDKTHCKKGHELSGNNLYLTPDGRRQCITCQRYRSNKHLLKVSNQLLNKGATSA